MTPDQTDLIGRLKRLGFLPGNHMRLYGEQFEFLSDPIIVGKDDVVVEVLDEKSGHLRSVRIPLALLRSGHPRLSDKLNNTERSELIEPVEA